MFQVGPPTLPVAFGGLEVLQIDIDKWGDQLQTRKIFVRLPAAACFSVLSCFMGLLVRIFDQYNWEGNREEPCRTKPGSIVFITNILGRKSFLVAKFLIGQVLMGGYPHLKHTGTFPVSNWVGFSKKYLNMARKHGSHF